MTHQFMAAMHANPKIAQGSKMGRRKLHTLEKQRRLRENLMKKARKLTYNQGRTQAQMQAAAAANSNSNQYGWQNQNQRRLEPNASIIIPSVFPPPTKRCQRV